MSLQGLLKELDETKARDQDRQAQLLVDQHESAIRAKNEEISSLREEIDTLRCWLDNSALPAYNPISKRPDSLNLIKMNFGDDKECPEMWAPGERELLETVRREPLAPENGNLLSDAPAPFEIPKLEMPKLKAPIPEARDPRHIIPEPELPMHKDPTKNTNPGNPGFAKPGLDIPKAPKASGRRKASMTRAASKIAANRKAKK